MNFKRLGSSFKESLHGLRTVFKSEQNFRLQVYLAILVIFLMFVWTLTKSEKIVLLLLIFLVLIMEVINSVVERLLDVVEPRLSGQVKLIKEIMAGAVFLSSLVALIIGIFIFYPYLIAL
ncbi:MAG: Diacylglycerol kinase [Candidatus Magasanikbacteria bacterium GW2011_GWC2_37_14]|uniref:Diacylglycerol kinase n=1 Tax=Candidatus Magasanikbacteria bacterium GW2011_GWC2_37_14 TaxID=1619046 RepID=A0A0G0GNB5_9BACT|nr:MAG: Diacylglycerol kinase [Candidatus Magasanikbacteria bacterium GW2011_GWC2_37_14]